MNKRSIVERLYSDLIAKNRDINVLLYFTFMGKASQNYGNTPGRTPLLEKWCGRVYRGVSFF